MKYFKNKQAVHAQTFANVGYNSHFNFIRATNHFEKTGKHYEVLSK